MSRRRCGRDRTLARGSAEPLFCARRVEVVDRSQHAPSTAFEVRAERAGLGGEAIGVVLLREDVADRGPGDELRRRAVGVADADVTQPRQFPVRLDRLLPAAGLPQIAGDAEQRLGADGWRPGASHRSQQRQRLRVIVLMKLRQVGGRECRRGDVRVTGYHRVIQEPAGRIGDDLVGPNDQQDGLVGQGAGVVRRAAGQLGRRH